VYATKQVRKRLCPNYMTRFREEVYGATWYKNALKAQEAEPATFEAKREAWRWSFRHLNYGKSRKTNRKGPTEQMSFGWTK